MGSLSSPNISRNFANFLLAQHNFPIISSLVCGCIMLFSLYENLPLFPTKSNPDNDLHNTHTNNAAGIQSNPQISTEYTKSYAIRLVHTINSPQKGDQSDKIDYKS